MKTKLLLILFSFLSFSTFAAYVRSGEITYKCLGGDTYEISVTTYTQGSNSPADRCYINVNFGDDTVQYWACRCNFEPGDPTTDPWGATCTSNPNCSTYHMGEWSMFPLCLDIKKNVYCVTHTYPGPGTYIISFYEPDRINNIINIPNQTPFYVEDTLVINPFINPCAGSPTFINPSLDTAHIGICHTYNPLAIDPDGDSLSYQLIPCMEESNTPIAGYFIPAGVTMDSVTGDLTWCSPPDTIPPSPNLYNFAIRIKKWKKISNNYIVVGTVMRDIQIFVEACSGMAVNDIINEIFISIFPNPAHNEFTIQVGNGQLAVGNKFTCSIKNLLGQTLAEKTFTGKTIFNLSNRANGLYFVELKDEKGMRVGTKKVVIE